MRGTVNKRYRVIRKLGKGGMGVVYLVEDLLCSDQELALKTIHAKALAAHNLAQFKYEFAALRQLRHPNLVSVFDFDINSKTGEHFFTMDYVPGEDLPHLIHSRLNQHPKEAFDYPWLYGIIVEVCRALQYLHSRGLIHHDVKPGNIRVTPDGVTKLMDCGLVGKPRDEGHLKIRGTPEYSAPELIRGGAVDFRADLYSLGISLYEIVTRRLPFTGESSIMVLRQHVEGSIDRLNGLQVLVDDGRREYGCL